MWDWKISMLRVGRKKNEASKNGERGGGGGAGGGGGGWVFFFFQAEDGIRDSPVTGVQTCALPILLTETPRETINH